MYSRYICQQNHLRQGKNISIYEAKRISMQRFAHKRRYHEYRNSSLYCPACEPEDIQILLPFLQIRELIQIHVFLYHQ